MLSHYLKVTIRFFIRQKTYGLINILALTLGLVCAIFIFLWVHDELSYDKFNTNYSLLAKAMVHITGSDGTKDTWSSMPVPLAHALKQEIPEIAEVFRMDRIKRVFSVKAKAFKETGVHADPELFTMLSLKILSGKVAALDERAIVISESLAKKYFAGENPINKVISINDREKVYVSAVFADLPKTSSFSFSFVRPFSGFLKKNPGMETNFGNYNVQTYILLKPNSDLNEINERIKGFIKERDKDEETELFLQPLSEVRLHASFSNGQLVGGRFEYVILFSLIGFLVLAIACINFMNLSTAYSVLRAKEVGVRKVVGAFPKWIATQFLRESLLFSFISFLFSLIIVWLLLPLFNEITSKEVAFGSLGLLAVVVFFGIVLFTGISAGIYPALFLSRLQPSRILKRNIGTAYSESSLRKWLVIVQFVFSFLLISFTLVVFKQIQFVLAKDLGFTKENIIYFECPPDISERYVEFKKELSQQSAIRNVSISDGTLLSIINKTNSVDWSGKHPDDLTFFNVVFCDFDLADQFEFKFIDGRNFSDSSAVDSLGFILTEKAVNRMGLMKPVGMEITVGDQRGKIIGVIWDYHNSPLWTEEVPAILFPRREFLMKPFGIINVKLKANETEKGLAQLKSVFGRFQSGFPLDYKFYDEEHADLYKSEMVLGKLSLFFSILGMSIACLGLFGLVSFAVERRTKEMGVRKALGASVVQLTLLNCKEFLRLVCISILIALPLSYYGMNIFLDRYMYHFQPGIEVYLYPSVIIVLLSLLTVSNKSYEAAVRNPIDALRME